MHSNIDTEELFNEDLRRFTLYPIKYQSVWDLYKKQSGCFWRTEEIDFSKDYQDFLKLKEAEQKVIKKVLAFFSGLDGIVNFNIQQNLINEFVPIEIQMCYGFQVAIENIHNETYSVMLDNLVRDKAEKNELLNSLETVPSIKRMKEYGLKYMNKEIDISDRLIAFACIEGIMFSGAFAIIFWLKNIYKGIIKGLIMSNDFISRDEGLHLEFGCLLYNMIGRKNKERTIKIIKEAVEIACDFMDDALNVKLIGINSNTMNDYIKYVADSLFVNLGYSKYYNKNNPFTFMNTIGLSMKTNFHDHRASEYQKSDLSNADDISELKPDDF